MRSRPAQSERTLQSRALGSKLESDSSGSSPKKTHGIKTKLHVSRHLILPLPLAPCTSCQSCSCPPALAERSAHLCHPPRTVQHLRSNRCPAGLLVAALRAKCCPCQLSTSARHVTVTRITGTGASSLSGFELLLPRVTTPTQTLLQLQHQCQRAAAGTAPPAGVRRCRRRQADPRACTLAQLMRGCAPLLVALIMASGAAAGSGYRPRAAWMGDCGWGVTTSLKANNRDGPGGATNRTIQTAEEWNHPGRTRIWG